MTFSSPMSFLLRITIAATIELVATIILSAFHHSFDLIRGPGVVALKPIVKFTRTPTVCRNVSLEFDFNISMSKFGAQDIRELFTDFKLITSGSSIMDLGCAPDARLQVACRSLGPSRNRGSILGIDMKECLGLSLHCWKSEG
uniref:Uncharacterized protein n=1 Tax=Cucumis melo TaxID=3656 RepID=A0A9I9E9Q7_CUCME